MNKHMHTHSSQYHGHILCGSRLPAHAHAHAIFIQLARFVMGAKENDLREGALSCEVSMNTHTHTHTSQCHGHVLCGMLLVPKRKNFVKVHDSSKCQ
jgi:hypothetical protein